jgi:hypothetical protein
MNLQLVPTPPKTLFDSELPFHHRVDYTFSQSLNPSGLTHLLTHSFATIYSLLLLCFTSVRSKLEYASPV